jgi:hypothetical protein
MASLTTCIAFIVENGSLPSSYLTTAVPTEISSLIEKVMRLYMQKGCSVQVLIGGVSIEQLTQTAVVPLHELFDFARAQDQ